MTALIIFFDSQWINCTIWNNQLKLTVEVFTTEMFNNFPTFTHIFAIRISIINPLISNDGNFVCCRVISEMQHVLETRLSFYEWRYEFLLNSRDRMAMMEATPLKVERSNKISPSLHPYFHNINTFNASLKSRFNFTYNLDEL